MTKPLEQMTQEEVRETAKNIGSKIDGLPEHDADKQACFELLETINQVKENKKYQSIDESEQKTFEEKGRELIRKLFVSITGHYIDKNVDVDFKDGKFILDYDFAKAKVKHSYIRDNLSFSLPKNLPTDFACSISGYKYVTAEGSVINSDLVKGFEFQKCAFENSVELGRGKEVSGIKFAACEFRKNTDFSEVSFSGNTIFSNSTFTENAIFTDSTFLGQTLFDGVVFEKKAIFYGVTFNQPPNFNQAIFKDEVNFVNTNLNFGYGELKGQIGNSAKIANDYRDSFRLIKNNLLKNNNTLDASQYHKMELYCKEIELESKEQKSPSDWLEKWQLWFYRKTSDHHTDLLKIIAWVLVWVGLCGLALFAYRYGGRLPLQPKSGSLLGVFQKSCGWVYDFLSAHHVGYVALLLLFASLFVSLLLGFVKWGLSCARCCKYLSFALGAVYSLCVTIQNPKYILGVANFTTLADSDWVENIILLLYTIGMILLLFSLQKTARKNTITPS